jgi:hypothetical protein
MAFCAGSSRPANALLAADMQTEWSKVALPRIAIPACALLNSKISVNVTHVPYRGLSAAANDLVAGQID